MNLSMLASLLGILLLACNAKVSESPTADTLRVAQVDVPQIKKDFLIGKINPANDSRFVKLADEHTIGSARGGYLLKETYEAFIKMATAAKESGLTLRIVASTRTFDVQKPIWESKWNGKALAGDTDLKTISDPLTKAELILRVSSMPGTSRYHWGTDVAINSMDEDYFLKPEGERVYQWLSSEATKFGFCQPYPSKEDGRSGYEEAKWQWSYKPSADVFIKEYMAQVTHEDIIGFAGSEMAAKVNIIDKYVGGVACYNLEMFGRDFEKVGIKYGDKIVINPDDYIEILSYSEGLIAVRNENGLWGFADASGKLVIACQFSSVGSFEKGRALVNTGDGSGWRNSYQYIDTHGNLLRKFFEPLSKTSKCIEGYLTGSNRSGESMAGYSLSNCPDGTMSYSYSGWEWGDAATYYPNTDIKTEIDKLANSQGEHAVIFKKFVGQPAEFKEGEFLVKFEITTDWEGALQSVNVSIQSSMSGANYTFSREGDGVLVERSHGS